MNHRIRLSLVMCTVGTALLAGCVQKQPVPQSDEPREHKASIDRCFSLMVEAGAKVIQGDQVADICRRQYPTRPDIARREIMTAMAKSGLIPENMHDPISLIEGECKQAAQQYVKLHERAYSLNDGDPKSKALSAASDIMSGIASGRCTTK